MNSACCIPLRAFPAFVVLALALAGCGNSGRPTQTKSSPKPDETKARTAETAAQQPDKAPPEATKAPRPAADGATPGKTARKPVAGKAVPAPVPDWALGALYVRELGNGLVKAGVYADKLLPNSAELAKQMVMSYLLELPADAGLKPDGPAAIYALDPLATNTKNERAFIVPVADAATLKTALINTYGVPTEEGGVMTFVLPQPVPQPDRTLLLKLAQGRLLGAPNSVVLRKLDEYAAENPSPFSKGN
ncbi:MAG: hypothetical protein NTW87_12820, partial [Planctomycetota bacterium]|nr:hypothetical protein [Planctomycetota bacterium]